MSDHDDEVTTDVDPDWIAAIRAEVAARSDPQERQTGPADSGVSDADADDDWREQEPNWDDEATIGVSSGILDRIRTEIAATRTDAPPPRPPAAPAHVTSPGATPDLIAEPSVLPDPPPPTTPTTTPPLTPSPEHDAVVSTTVRWEPRQRLTASAPLKDESAVIDPTQHVGMDRTKIAIALIAAATVILVVWLFVRDGGGSDAPPTGSTPTVSVEGGSVPAVTAAP